VLVVLGAQVQDRARRASDGVRGLDLGVVHDRLADLRARHPSLAEQLDERVRLPPERRVVDRRRVALDHPVALEPIDPALDRGRGQRDAPADVLERTPGILPHQCNDSLVDCVHQTVRQAWLRNKSPLNHAPYR
jgi:hypothetical protein